MQKGKYLSSLLRSNQTIFTLKDIALLWQETDTGATRVRLNYYVKKGSLFRLRRGLYSKNKKPDSLEIAIKIFTPSYISFETVLLKDGLIFQYQNKVTVASYLTREIKINDQVFSFRKVKNAVLMNNIGIANENNISIATKERAFLDTLYSNIDFHFDNLRSLNWNKVLELLPNYSNKRMAKTVNNLYKENL